MTSDKQAALRLAIVGSKIFWTDPLDGIIYMKNGERMFCLRAYEAGGDECCSPQGEFDVGEITDEAQKEYFLKEAAKYYRFIRQEADRAEARKRKNK